MPGEGRIRAMVRIERRLLQHLAREDERTGHHWIGHTFTDETPPELGTILDSLQARGLLDIHVEVFEDRRDYYMRITELGWRALSCRTVEA